MIRVIAAIAESIRRGTLVARTSTDTDGTSPNRLRGVKLPVLSAPELRKSRGCRDFVVASGPIEPDRVNVYEELESEHALLTFRGAGPDEGLTSSIVRADVARHVVASSGPP